MNEWINSLQVSAYPPEADELCDLDEFLSFVIRNRYVEGFALHMETVYCPPDRFVVFGASISGCEPRWLAAHGAECIECLDRLYADDEASRTFASEFVRLEEAGLVNGAEKLPPVPDDVRLRHYYLLMAEKRLLFYPDRKARFEREPSIASRETINQCAPKSAKRADLNNSAQLTRRAYRR